MTQVLDKSVMPFIVLPLTNSHGPSKKYLGYKAVTGDREISVEFVAVDGLNSDMQQALYEFWQTDCNYGTTPFLISLPFMGSPFDDNYPNFLCRFTGGLSSSFDGAWSTKQKLSIVGEVNHVGELIAPDTKTITWS